MRPSTGELSDRIDEATTELLGTVAGLTDADLRAPSLLPGWSCEHLLNHLAGTAEMFADLLSGGPGRLPPEPPEGRRVTDLAADLKSSADRFRETVARRPAGAWAEPVALPGASRPVPAAELLVRRLVEVEVHHVDLGHAYRSEDWPASFNELELADPMRQWRADRLR